MDPSKRPTQDEGAGNGSGVSLPGTVANVLLCRSLTSRKAKSGCYIVVGLSILLGVIPWVDDLISKGALQLPIF